MQDLAQEVFARAFRPANRERVVIDRSYTAYLGTIAKNVLFDHLRRNERMISVAPEHMASASKACTKLSDAAARRLIEVVGDYVRELEPVLQEVYRLLYVDGCSQRDAAVRLGVGRQVVRSRAMKMRSELRERFVAVERLMGAALFGDMKGAT
jgi:RNA polymerase sigma factor (sigma-70 family)